MSYFETRICLIKSLNGGTSRLLRKKKNRARLLAGAFSPKKLVNQKMKSTERLERKWKRKNS